MSRILAISSLLLSFTSFAQATEPSDQAALLECDQLTFEADDLECVEAHCTLSGNALVTCGETSLGANRIILSFDPKGSFQGLSAQEEVSLESPSHRILCSKLDVESDQIRGILTDASLTLRETRPDGTVGIRVTASGSINRLSEHSYKIAPASFSLCDCGDNALPSWSIKSLWMDLDTKDRATLYQLVDRSIRHPRTPYSAAPESSLRSAHASSVRLLAAKNPVLQRHHAQCRFSTLHSNR